MSIIFYENNPSFNSFIKELSETGESQSFYCKLEGNLPKDFTSEDIIYTDDKGNRFIIEEIEFSLKETVGNFNYYKIKAKGIRKIKQQIGLFVNTDQIIDNIMDK